MAKKLSTKALDYLDGLMGNMSKKDEEALGKAIGFLVGSIPTDKYNSLSDAEKQEWDRKRVVHHGDFGAIVEDYGRRKKSPIVKGLGSGLMDSDRQDEHLWTYSPIFVQKPRPKKKIRRK